MKTATVPVFTLLLASTGWASGCSQAPEGWTPVMEETSTAFLEEETERVLSHVRSAMEEIGADSPPASGELEHAAVALEHLLDYYLPLIHAREQAYNAYRLFYLGDEAGVGQILTEVEEILTTMAGKAEGQRLQEIESLAETLGRTRMAAASGAEGEREALEVLARRLNQAALKGDLVLR